MKYTTLFALVAVIALANCAYDSSAKEKCDGLSKITGLSAVCNKVAEADGTATSQVAMASKYVDADAATAD